METHAFRQVINDYITAYNTFDIAGMLATLHPDIEFRNRSNGEVTLTINGIDAFEAQARHAAQLFTERRQTVTDISFDETQAEVSIDYTGVLAVDLPNGLKAGDTLVLKGKSIFRFSHNKIILLEDIS